MLKPYRTIEHDSEAEFIIYKSRFISRAFRVKNEDEVNEHLQRIRKQHYDATHNCYAYSLGINGELARFSDDGEPGGTAGLPMMEALRHKGVTDLLVIVTRYFGGILLGAGGLVRAYSRGAVEAIDAAGMVSMEPGLQVEFSVEYPLYGMLEGFLREHASDVEVDYQEVVRLRMMVAAEQADWFRKELVERSCGRVTPAFAGEAYMKRIIMD